MKLKAILIAVVATFTFSSLLLADEGLPFLKPGSAYSIKVPDRPDANVYYIVIVSHVKDDWYAVKYADQKGDSTFWINFASVLSVNEIVMSSEPSEKRSSRPAPIKPN